MTPPRVLITGIGVLLSLGRTVEEFGDALFAGRTCIGPITGFEVADKRYTLGGELKDFAIEAELPNADTKRMFRYSQYALVAASRAISDAHLECDGLNRDRIGTAFSTAAAGLSEAVEYDAKRYFSRGDHGISPVLWAEFTPSACTTHVAIHFGLRGPCGTLSAGCVSGVDSIAWGVQQIRAGRADAMVVGGADAMFTPFMWSALYRSGILAPVPEDGGSIPRPFSYDHNGIALVEGGSALVLESETHARVRGARVYGELSGIGSVEEARPLTDLDPSGRAYAVTMQRVMADAGVPPAAIDWVCAHGTGYPGADCAESRGIETALGDHAFRVPVSSVRGAIGQSFASGGGLQVAAACVALARQHVPATLNFSRPDDGCRLDYVPNVPRPARLRRVIVCAAGVGGTHSGLMVEGYDR
ncbi:MAG TPA: beta-ketoacyl-[acyl-carrier-protein] synthase family protein [Armatimonadota bacterium]|nr:beta-ketoacyl-[acyl-carrier-protein] synthase family protein [Armatimonadota bacterium]